MTHKKENEQKFLFNYSKKLKNSLFLKHQNTHQPQEVDCFHIKTAINNIVDRLHLLIQRTENDSALRVLKIIFFIAENEESDVDRRETVTNYIKEKTRSHPNSPSAEQYTDALIYLADILKARPDHPIVKEAEVSLELAADYMKTVSQILKEHIKNLQTEIPELLEATKKKISAINLHGSFHKPTDTPPEEAQEQQEQRTPDQIAAVV